MKKIFFVFALLINCLSWAQKLSNENKNQKKYIEIIENIYKEVKTYDYNPTYWLDINASDCTYEILVNDMPLNVYHDIASNTQVSIPLNTRILKSGDQKLTLKVYPALTDSFNFKESLIESSEITLKISYGEFGKEKAKDYKVVLEKKTPKMKTSYYEIELPFKATVPFDLTGWSKSVDLSHEKEEILLAEVEKKYQEFIKLYENKDSEAVFSKYYNRNKEIAQSLFSNKAADSKEVADKIEKDINKNIPFKLEKYTMKLFANGRVVALIRNDKFYKGMSAFFCQDDDNYSTYALLLHRPKPGVALEVIR